MNSVFASAPAGSAARSVDAHRHGAGDGAPRLLRAGAHIEHQEGRPRAAHAPRELGGVGLEDDAVEVGVHGGRECIGAPASRANRGRRGARLLHCPAVTFREGVSTDLATLALDELHQRLGARFTDEHGTAVPADYGEPAAEAAALREACGVVDLSWAGRLELRGRDRHRFLNGLVTSNSKDLRPGSGVYGFLLNKQGRVLADVYVTALDDRLWLELPAGSGDRLRQHIESYRVIDDVELAPLDDMALLGVLGPEAAAALDDAAAALAIDRTARVAIEGCEVQLTHRRVLGVEGSCCGRRRRSRQTSS